MQSGRYSVAHKVIDYLKENIANGNWKVGDKIPSENTLTRELGVSRVSVRLAIQQFIALGVMKSHHGKGTFLVSDSRELINAGPAGVSENECRDVEKILEFRLMIEPEGCFLAVGKTDEQTVENLRRHLNALVASIGDSEEFVKNDIRFHVEIGRASGNPLVEKYLREVFAHNLQDHKHINKLFGYKDGVYYHSLILKAFETKNAKLARKLMDEHLRNALEQIKK